MTTYSLKIFSLDSATTSAAGILEQSPSGAQWGWYSSPTLTVNTGAAPTQVEISDTDGSSGTLDDDSEGQVLTQDTVIGGVTYAAGSMLQDEYEVSLTDGTNTYRLVAISVRTYSDPYTYNDQIIGFSWEGDAPPEGVTLTYVASSNQDYASMVPCFTPGTQIETPDGPRPVESLRVGDTVLTLDHGAQPLRWIARRHLNAGDIDLRPELCPIRIAAGALGPGRPAQDLVVSPQHRILLRSRIVERMTTEPEVLIAARHLTALPGISVLRDACEPAYIHVLFDRHEVVIANGTEAETLLLGPEVTRTLPRATRQAWHRLLPDLDPTNPPPPARPLVTGKKARNLVARHHRNAKVLQDTLVTVI
ncbi:Hint domain-containing protein [Thioclava sp. L04-15]|uniref:Hint domain-containing protein n=1 Tax=Thioclava sp. L04-15 TaxID=1915318 RepID=UPI0009960268|nr:Hint domain-containing protein [Thioclava sp. L04-15]TNE94556.1 MAG: Hint domain-containing protein [Paracoccaceae bacterium]